MASVFVVLRLDESMLLRWCGFKPFDDRKVGDTETNREVSYR